MGMGRLKYGKFDLVVVANFAMSPTGFGRSAPVWVCLAFFSSGGFAERSRR
jgi:hypothetical protein